MNKKKEKIIVEESETPNENVPECEYLYISTKTKVLYLNQPIDIYIIYFGKFLLLSIGNHVYISKIL